MFRQQLTKLVQREGTDEKLAARCAARGDHDPKITDGSIGEWRNGKSLPTLKSLFWLAECTGVSLEWLCRGKGPESSALTRSPEALSQDLASHLVGRAAEVLNIPVNRASGVLTVDGEAVLDEFTELLLDRFKRACERFKQDSSEAFARYRAVKYLEQLTHLTETGVPGVDRSSLLRMETAILELTEELQKLIPDIEGDELTSGIWFLDHGQARAFLSNAPQVDLFDEVEGPLMALSRHLARAKRREQSTAHRRARADGMK